MFKKLILSLVILSVLIGAGFGLAYKDDANLAIRIREYHTQYDAGNYEQAYTIATQLVADGHMNAHYFLGLHYESGYAIPQDMSQAVEHYKLAASAEYPLAQAYLGSLYAIGDGVKKDEKRAVYWFEKAAANDYPHAQYLLGKMYKNGTGVPQDTTKARKLLQSASEQGILAADADLAKLAALDMGLR